MAILRENSQSSPIANLRVLLDFQVAAGATAVILRSPQRRSRRKLSWTSAKLSKIAGTLKMASWYCGRGRCTSGENKDGTQGTNLLVGVIILV